MTNIIIEQTPNNFEAIIHEIPTKTKVIGNCKVTKNKEGKYIVSNIQYYPKQFRIMAIGFEHCTHITNNFAYDKQKKLGNMYSKNLLNYLNEKILI